MDDRIKDYLHEIYGNDEAILIAKKLKTLIDKWRKVLPKVESSPDGRLPVSSEDSIMITYGDSLQEEGKTPLQALHDFALKRFDGAVKGIHVLPFSPYSSDDGFSVIDYREVNPDLGTWGDLEALGKNFRLMADLVLNHCSAQGPWFRAFLAGEEPYKEFFIIVEEGTDLSAVFRPRALPLLHEFEVAGEKRQVWTTFSGDQVDLNFANPLVFLEMVDILLSYVSKGIRVIRLDAIGFLWKEIGTSCMHHPLTHLMVKLFRLVLAETAPGTILITETNVPHKENISYFGEGNDEAHMVYQFPLPPLTLDAFIRGDSSHLSTWAATLPPPNADNTFFNFLASHDGVGVLPAKGYLSSSELDALVATVKERGGLVSYKSTPEGDIPYELNISYRDAVAESTLPPEKRAAKFLASQGVMLSLAGVPGIYVHSLLGSGNWKDGVAITGVNRTINREKLAVGELEKELDEPGSLRRLIFLGYLQMLRVRGECKAFQPQAAQKILNLGSELFALIRGDSSRDQILCLITVVDHPVTIALPQTFTHCTVLHDLVSGQDFGIQEGHLTIPGWSVLWLEARD